MKTLEPFNNEWNDCISYSHLNKDTATVSLLRCVAAELRASGSVIPPSLLAWEQDMVKIDEFHERRRLREEQLRAKLPEDVQ